MLLKLKSVLSDTNIYIGSKNKWNSIDKMDLKKILMLAPIVFVSIVLSIWLLDFPIAKWVGNFLLRHTHLYTYSSNLSDFLFLIVIVLSTLSWLEYFYRTKLRLYDKHTRFFSVVGTVLPLAFVTKDILKSLFGRIETRHWLAEPNAVHWFNSGDGFRGFPSGHMLVFTSLIMSLWYFYPRFRFIYPPVLVCLGLALIMTDFHFLSDVIAGAYLGAIVYFSSVSFIEKNQ